MNNSDSTVKKNHKKKESQVDDEPPSYPAPLPPNSGKSKQQGDNVSTKEEPPINQLQGLLMEELSSVILDNEKQESDEEGQTYENVVVTHKGEILLLENHEEVESTTDELVQDQSDDRRVEKAEPGNVEGQFMDQSEAKKQGKIESDFDRQVMDQLEARTRGKAESDFDRQVIDQSETSKSGKVQQKQSGSKAKGQQGKDKSGTSKAAAPKSVMAKLLRSPKKGKSGKAQGYVSH